MSCNECKYWVDGGHFGTCKRYPTATSKAPSDWCGEFSDKAVKGLPPIEEVLGDFPEIKRKPGRPPKGEE
jgi:hypothetical protein